MYYDYGGGPCLDGLQKARGMLIPSCVPAIAAPLPSSVFIPPSSPPLVADESSHGIVLTPGAIGLIFVTIMALLLVCLCSTEVTKGIVWSRRHGSDVGSAPVVQRTAAPMISLGLAEWGIMRIPVAKYKKEGRQRIESMECAVCLSPFEEDESVRMLPQCGHAFHLPCIDEWLQRHSNCPLCRMEITLDTIKALMQQLIPATSGIDHDSAPQERDPSEITEMAENRHILGVEFNSNVATSQLELPGEDGGEVAMLAGYACRSSDERPATKKLQGEDQANVQAPSTSNCFTDSELFQSRIVRR